MGDTEGMKTLLAVAVLTLVGVSACGSDASDPTSPSKPSASTSAPVASSGAADAVKQLMTALEAGDCDQAKAVVVTPDTIDCEVIESLASSYENEGVAVADGSFDESDVEGESGAVTVSWDGADPETWNVEQIDGQWKVLFDSEE